MIDFLSHFSGTPSGCKSVSCSSGDVARYARSTPGLISCNPAGCFPLICCLDFLWCLGLGFWSFCPKSAVFHESGGEIIVTRRLIANASFLLTALLDCSFWNDQRS